MMGGWEGGSRTPPKASPDRAHRPLRDFSFQQASSAGCWLLLKVIIFSASRGSAFPPAPLLPVDHPAQSPSRLSRVGPCAAPLGWGLPASRAFVHLLPRKANSDSMLHLLLCPLLLVVFVHWKDTLHTEWPALGTCGPLPEC